MDFFKVNQTLNMNTEYEETTAYAYKEKEKKNNEVNELLCLLYGD